MGLANVVPGVSGGTIALLTGIFERFINALKSFDIEAFKLLFRFKLKEFAEHTDLLFLLTLIVGEFAGIFSFSRLLEFLFEKNFDIYVWAFFFGLILASVYYIAKTIKQFTLFNILFMLLGVSLAVGLFMVNPATENTNPFYLVLCGLLAICDMLLPGISGSYTLMLLGNYKLIMIDSINHLRFEILIPVAIGAAIGFVAFSRFLSWVLKNYFNQTLSLLSGFVFGSLLFIWPWKDSIYQLQNGIEVFDRHGKPVVEGYILKSPDWSSETFIAIALAIAGIVLVCVIEELSKRKKVVEVPKKDPMEI